MPKVFSSKNFHYENRNAHGDYEVWIEHNIFHCVLTGPMNVEGIKALGRVRRACIAESKVTELIPAIVEYRHSMLMAPDALALYAQEFKQHLSQLSTPMIVAYVVPEEVEGRSIMLPFFEKIFQENKVRWCAFESMSEALTWLRTCLKER